MPNSKSYGSSHSINTYKRNPTVLVGATVSPQLASKFIRFTDTVHTQSAPIHISRTFQLLTHVGFRLPHLIWRPLRPKPIDILSSDRDAWKHNWWPTRSSAAGQPTNNVESSSIITARQPRPVGLCLYDRVTQLAAAAAAYCELHP